MVPKTKTTKNVRKVKRTRILIIDFFVSAGNNYTLEISTFEYSTLWTDAIMTAEFDFINIT